MCSGCHAGGSALLDGLHLDAAQHGDGQDTQKFPAELERVENVSVLEEILQRARKKFRVTSRQTSAVTARKKAREMHLAQKLAFELGKKLEKQPVLRGEP